jgi:hypothetical protein
MKPASDIKPEQVMMLAEDKLQEEDQILEKPSSIE